MKRANGGMSLLEVLVAIVILSLGLMGLAGLQAASLRNNQTAYYRSIATQQAYDIADRMRANLAGVRAGNYSDLDNTIPADPACFATGCSPADMAITDHRQWNTNNAVLLPGGQGTLECTDGPGAGCTNNSNNWSFLITITWNERTGLQGEFETVVTP